MESGPARLGLVYDQDAYVEFPQGPPAAPASPSKILYGRRVAGKEFLEALLNHGTWSELVALTYSDGSSAALQHLWRTHPTRHIRSRHLYVVEERYFHEIFLPNPPATVLHLPCPPIARYAWARQDGGPGRFALSGVTHTLCALSDACHLVELVTAPFEPYDALVCTSRAAVQQVRAVTGAYADYLRDRHGGSPGLRLRLELIPLGVDTERYRPPTEAERANCRRALKVAEDEVVVLFVGRLSFHQKAHPFPMFQGLARAARRTGQRVHLVLAGDTGNEAVRQVFMDGACTLATGVRVSLIDSQQSEWRHGVWWAADLFTSLADNLQETFGLVVLEAMASGLPVVASDWDGYRDLVVDGQTGYLVPTYMIPGATADTTSRLVFGEIGYEEFVAQCNQATAVDVAASAAAYTRLIQDTSLRRQMGKMGRRRAVDQFAWPKIIRGYEQLWKEQERERLARAQRDDSACKGYNGPALYPSPETSFAGHPSVWLRAEDRIVTAEDAEGSLEMLLSMPLTNYLGHCRCQDLSLLRSILMMATHPCPLSELERALRRVGISHIGGRSTLAWMVKYGLLEIVPGPDPEHVVVTKLLKGS